MIRCRDIAPLLHDVADLSAAPDEVLRVRRHVRDCTACRIALARERRLGATIAEMPDETVDELFTAAVMARLPERTRARRRYRRGLRLAVLAVLLLAGAAILGTAPGDWSTNFFDGARPAPPADVSDPERQIVSLAQTLLLALQSVASAPLVSTVAGAGGATTWLALAAAAIALGLLVSCALAALLAGFLARSGRTTLAV